METGCAGSRVASLKWLAKLTQRRQAPRAPDSADSEYVDSLDTIDSSKWLTNSGGQQLSLRAFGESGQSNDLDQRRRELAAFPTLL